MIIIEIIDQNNENLVLLVTISTELSTLGSHHAGTLVVVPAASTPVMGVRSEPVTGVVEVSWVVCHVVVVTLSINSQYM